MISLSCCDFHMIVVDHNNIMETNLYRDFKVKRE